MTILKLQYSNPILRLKKTRKLETCDYNYGYINIKKMKIFAYEKLPKDSHLRNVLLIEDDEISVDEFLTSSKIWLRLLRSIRRE